VRWRRLRLEGSARRLSFHRRLSNGATRWPCVGTASRLETPVRRLSSLPPPVQRRGKQLRAEKRRGEAAVRWRRSRLEALCRLSSHRRLDAARRGGCVLAPPPPTGGLHRSPLVSVAASTAARRAAVRWTAARRGSCELAPPLDSRRPFVASRLIARTAARRAAARWTAARRAARRGMCGGAARQQCAGAASRLETSVCRLSSHHRLDSGAARQPCAGAASRLEAPVRRLSSPSPPGQRRGEQLCAGAASHLETPVRRLLPLSPPVQRRGEAGMRWTAARRSSYALDSGARGSSALAPPLDSRPPSVASWLGRRLYSGAVSSGALDSGAARQLCTGAASQSRDACPSPLVSVAACTAARRAAMRWAAARLSSCALAPPPDSRRPSVASRLCRPLYSGAVRQLCAGQRRGKAAVRWRRLSTRDARPSPLISVAAWTAARRAAVRWTAARLGSCVLAPPSTQRAASRRSGADNAKGLVQRSAQPRPH